LVKVAREKRLKVHPRKARWLRYLRAMFLYAVDVTFLVEYTATGEYNVTFRGISTEEGLSAISRASNVLGGRD